MAKRFKDCDSVRELGLYLNKKKFVVPDCAVFLTHDSEIFVGVYHKGERVARVEYADCKERELVMKLLEYWQLDYCGVSKKFGLDPWRKSHNLHWTVYMSVNATPHYDYIKIVHR